MVGVGLFLLACLSGTFGRMGGAGKSGQWYDFLLHAKWRDWGCALILTAVAAVISGAQLQFWWVYAAIFLFHWWAFSTYWDWLFGYDNLWFSGLMTGLAVSPILFIDINLWPLVLVRAIVLMVVWGCLNKYLPQRGVWIWRRDVADEFSRYFTAL